MPEAVKEGVGAHSFGVFRDELIDDEIFAVGAELIEFALRLIGNMGGCNDAVFVAQNKLGFWKTGESYDLTCEFLCALGCDLEWAECFIE